VRQQMEETIDKEYQNDKEIFSYEKIRGFYQEFLARHRDECLKKLNGLNIQSRIEEVYELEEGQRLKIMQILMEGFRIEIGQEELTQALSDESVWSSYKRAYPQSQLPEYPIFMDDLKEFMTILSEGSVSTEEIAEEIADYVTYTENVWKGYQYKAECNSGSVFVTLAQKTYESEQKFGWKFHISISPDNANLKIAWDIVKDVLIENVVSSFKVIAPGENLNSGQAGCQITIYQFEDPEKDWLHILRTIEQALIEHNIKPHGYHDVDKRLKGSNYITYRNDMLEGEYISARQVKERFANEEGKWYNPSGSDNPFKEFDVSPEPQQGRLGM